MKKNSPNDLLDEAIQLLETKRDLELILMKRELNGLFESLKPINIVKNTFRKVIASTDLKEGIVNTAIGVASGFMVKNILFRKTHNPFKLIARGILQTVTTGVVATNSDKIKSNSQKIFHAVLSTLTKRKKVNPESEVHAKEKIIASEPY